MKVTRDDGSLDPVLFQRYEAEQARRNGSATTAPSTSTRGPPKPPDVPVTADPPTLLDADRPRRTPALGFYTQVPNVAFDLPARLGFDLSVFSVLMQLCRLTYGMQSPSLTTKIGMRKLAERAQVSRTTLYAALAVLEGHQLIERSVAVGARGGYTATEIRLTLPKK